MTNIIEFFEVIFGYTILGLYTIIGLCCDVVIKTTSLVIYLILMILALLSAPLIPSICYLRHCNFLYELGGCWEPCAKNYFVTNYLTNKILEL